MALKLGVLDFNPIQYHVPLYQLLAKRGDVALDVMYLHDHGLRPVINSEFGVAVHWNIDLLSGYRNRFLTTSDSPASIAGRMLALRQWISSQDAVVVYGYSKPWMLLGMAICRSHHIPYLLRGDSRPESQFTGVRRRLRDAIARVAVRRSGVCLAIGMLNDQFYRRYGAQDIIFAPYSVDDARFANLPNEKRSELLERWGLEDSRPVIMFCGKLYAGKRPLDITAAAKLLPHKVTVVFVGDGVLAEQVRTSLRPGEGIVTGFVNQSELPAYYHAADVLVLPSESEKWGLVVNEAMAAGALPVVSDRVGAAPDLVSGIGEVYKCGDIADLADALTRALSRAGDPRTRARVREHANRYSLDRTALGFEEAAALAVTRGRRKPTQEL